MSVSDTLGVRRRRFPWGLVVPTAGLVVFAIVTWYPFIFMLATSLKTRPQFFESYWWFTFPFDWMNYVEVWPRVSRAILNSLLYSSLTLALTLLLSLLGGYAFGRFNFRGKDIVFLAELGDKSMLFSLTAATRYRWWLVLTAVSIAAALL
jgi:ABC-type glycerol-3-phosphate transport system permease component